MESILRWDSDNFSELLEEFKNMDFSEDLDPEDDAEDYSEYEEYVQSKREPQTSKHRRQAGGSIDVASIATLSEDSVGGSPPTKRLDSILV